MKDHLPGGLPRAGVRNYEPAMRPCLGGCGKPFLSVGKGYRCCPKCKDRRGRMPPFSARQERTTEDTR